MTNDADFDLIRRMFTAFSSGNLAELQQCFDPEVEHYIPGTHALAGVFRGMDSVLANLANTAAAADSMIATVEDLLTDNLGQVLAVYRLQANRNGKVLDHREAILFTVANGRVTRLREFVIDPVAIESFWA